MVVLAASAPGRVCLAGESLDWMTGGDSGWARYRRVADTDSSQPSIDTLGKLPERIHTRARLIPARAAA